MPTGLLKIGQHSSRGRCATTIVKDTAACRLLPLHIVQKSENRRVGHLLSRQTWRLAQWWIQNLFQSSQ